MQLVKGSWNETENEYMLIDADTSTGFFLIYFSFSSSFSLLINFNETQFAFAILAKFSCFSLDIRLSLARIARRRLCGANFSIKRVYK